MKQHQIPPITTPNPLFPSPNIPETWTYWDSFIEDNHLTTFTIKEDNTLEFYLFEDSLIFNENPKGNILKIQRRIKTILNTSSFPQDLVKTAKKAYRSSPQYMHLAIDRTDLSDMRIFNVLDEEFESIRDLEEDKKLKKVEDEEFNWRIFGMCRDLNFINAHEQELEEDDYYQELPMKKNKKGRKKGEKTVRIKKEKQESDIKVKTELTYWERDLLMKRGEMPLACEETHVNEENEEISETSEEELDLIIMIEAAEDDDKLENNEQEYLLKEDEEDIIEVILVELEKEEPEEDQEVVIMVEFLEEDKSEQEEVVILVELEEDEFEEDFEECQGSSEVRKRFKNQAKKELRRRERERERILNGETEYGLVNGKRRRENSSEKRRI